MVEFLKDCYEATCSWTVENWRVFYYKCLDRLEFGLRKYGKPITLHDGRDTHRDAWEEAFDLCIYLKKAELETDNSMYRVLYDRALAILVDLEATSGRETEVADWPRD